MTPRQRLQTVLAGKIPDRVPVAPDFSNMIPAKLTGKPFWDLYLYNDPPIWEAYIACAKRFDIDSVMDGYVPVQFPEPAGSKPPVERFIVGRDPQKIIVQNSWVEDGKRRWSDQATAYFVDLPPQTVRLEKLNLPPQPSRFEPVEGVKPVPTGEAALRRAKELMGDQGLVGVWLTGTVILANEDAVYDFYDNPAKYEGWAQGRVEQVEKRFAQLMAMETKPDFFCVGGSGTLIFQTMDIFRKYAFPAVKRGIELATAAGYPTQVHSCGPEAALVKVMAEETSLTVIDPLEIRPMGDCDLAELKRLYGRKLTLKGNLHTTNTMLLGTPDDVAAAARKAIDDAAEGGRFILSTGDQCGRDTPLENLQAMIETARTYGKY